MSDKPMSWETLKTEYMVWFNKMYPTPITTPPTTPKTPPTDDQFENTPGSIKDINAFMKDNNKWTLSCCWQTGNLDYGMQKNLCPNTDYSIDGDLSPSPKCDTMMGTYCKDDPEKEEICGCYRTDEATGDASWRLWKKMSDINPDLSPSCIINRCHTTKAYKPSSMQKKTCPNVCSAISNIPDSQTYVSVDCSPNDIIVNNIGDITESGGMHNIYTTGSGNNNNPYYTSSLFYILLAIIILLSGAVIYKKYKR
jgi:hypothetical protein